MHVTDRIHKLNLLASSAACHKYVEQPSSSIRPNLSARRVLFKCRQEQFKLLVEEQKICLIMVIDSFPFGSSSKWNEHIFAFRAFSYILSVIGLYVLVRVATCVYIQLLLIQDAPLFTSFIQIHMKYADIECSRIDWEKPKSVSAMPPFVRSSMEEKSGRERERAISVIFCFAR